MPYSIGNSQLQVVKGDTNQALQAIGQAYGAVNDSYDKLARLPGMAKAMVQDDADARYTAALNKYSNDPNGLAQALANGEIDTSNVRAETLGKTQDTLSNIQRSHTLGYFQDRTETANKYWDQHGDQYLQAVAEAQGGHPEKLNALRAQLGPVPWEIASEYAKLNGQEEKDKQTSLAQQGAHIGLQYRMLADMQASNAAQLELMDGLRKNVDFNNPDSKQVTIEVYNYLMAHPELTGALVKTKEGMNFLIRVAGADYMKLNSIGTDDEQAFNGASKQSQFLKNIKFNYTGEM